jgi:AcrR family transcriptional regulator
VLRSPYAARVAASADQPPAPSLAYRAATATETSPPRATPAEAFRLARRSFLKGERLDMSQLAQELGVSRPTLYRWTGDRDALLVDVIWSLTEELLADAVREAKGKGAEYALSVTLGFLHRTAAAVPLRVFLENDGARALRLVTGRHAVHGRLVLALRALIAETEERDGWQAPLAPDTLAYAIVRLGEAFVYNDEINHLEPDLGSARDTIARLIGAKTTKR